MGMSMYVRGYKPPDEKFQKMKAVWDNCEALGIPVPKEVDKFFNGQTPTADGVMITGRALEDAGCVKKYRGEHEGGYDIDVTKIPPDVKIIRLTFG